jgi:hypothetical protein
MTLFRAVQDCIQTSYFCPKLPQEAEILGKIVENIGMIALI